MPVGSEDLGDLAAKLDGVEAAMKRLDAGTYGVCESCGAPLEDERLEGDPTQTRCSSCIDTEASLNLAEAMPTHGESGS
ncbi:MAG: TraR/DksA C4-type zinc finger protein [Actinomycetes bacterium]